jgi:hypothetical protein
VTNEANGASENEESVEGTDGEVLGLLLGREGAGALDQVAEARGNGTIDIEDESLQG